MGAYREAANLPLDQIRKLAAAKYITGSSFAKYTNTEAELRSDEHSSKMADKNLSLLTVASYTSELFERTQINSRKVAKQMTYSATPDWEVKKADFDIDYTVMKKQENPHILSYLVKHHIADNYSNHLKIHIDGSVLQNEAADAFFLFFFSLLSLYQSLKQKRVST